MRCFNLVEFSPVNLSGIDFVDFGSGIGGSLDYCEKRFDGFGLGIDNDEHKVATAQALGRNVCLGDILAIPGEKVVSFVSMMDFLEHLPSEAVAAAMIEKACALASDFIFIAHPSFEDEHYLRSLGLKQYWQDWHGHPTHLMLSEIVIALRHNGVETIEIEFLEAALESSHETILPLSAPTDSHKYNAELHGPKEVLVFDRPVYRQIRIIGRLGKADTQIALSDKSNSAQMRKNRAQKQSSISSRLSGCLRKTRSLVMKLSESIKY